MRTHSRATVHAGGRLGSVHCAPPLTVRQVHAEAGVCGLCLDGTAAAPLAGDDLTLELIVESEARVRLSATGASIAQGRGGAPSSLTMRARLDDGARLDADPGAVVVCAGSRVDLTVSIELAARSQLDWREVIVLGRTLDDAPGAVTIRWDVTRAGRPVLRQFVDLTDPQSRRWAGAGHRVLASALRSGPDVTARTVVHSPTAVTQRIDETTELTTVLGDSAADVTRTLDALGRLARTARTAPELSVP